MGCVVGMVERILLCVVLCFYMDMNRRKVLSGVSVGVGAALAGCSQFLPGSTGDGNDGGDGGDGGDSDGGTGDPDAEVALSMTGVFGSAYTLTLEQGSFTASDVVIREIPSTSQEDSSETAWPGNGDVMPGDTAETPALEAGDTIEVIDTSGEEKQVYFEETVAFEMAFERGESGSPATLTVESGRIPAGELGVIYDFAPDSDKAPAREMWSSDSDVIEPGATYTTEEGVPAEGSIGAAWIPNGFDGNIKTVWTEVDNGEGRETETSVPNTEFEYNGEGGNPIEIVHAGGDEFDASRVTIAYRDTESEQQTQVWGAGTVTEGGSTETETAVAGGSELRIRYEVSNGDVTILSGIQVSQ